MFRAWIEYPHFNIDQNRFSNTDIWLEKYISELIIILYEFQFHVISIGKSLIEKINSRNNFQ